MIDCGSIVFVYRFNPLIRDNRAFFPKNGSFVKGRILLYALYYKEPLYFNRKLYAPDEVYVNMDNFIYYWKVNDIFYAIDKEDEKILHDVPVAFNSLDGKWKYKRVGEANSQKHYEEYENKQYIPFYLVECSKLARYTEESKKKYDDLVPNSYD
ncbi:hypothetical protein MCHI_000644 [Candidatus Magnetoovum chiemensis]|nr:hypothetical protein MCHI_000644 [Candidatus Magnetoovum chiemensis]